jgi:hypothetical protein
LSELIANIMHGRIDVERLSPQLVGALRKDLPKLQVRPAQLGVAVTQDGVITGASVPL